MHSFIYIYKRLIYIYIYLYIYYRLPKGSSECEFFMLTFSLCLSHSAHQILLVIQFLNVFLVNPIIKCFFLRDPNY